MRVAWFIVAAFLAFGGAAARAQQVPSCPHTITGPEGGSGTIY